MKLQDKRKIASSFSGRFDTFHPNIKLTVEEFKIFEEGVYANDMDEKWNLFVLDNFMYLAQSWTDTCIYKVQVKKQSEFIFLEKVFVTRDKTQYRINNIEKDKILFLKLLQVYLGRDDIYVDPAFQFKVVRQILSQHEPLDNYIKSIARQSVAINKIIYQNILHLGEDYAQKTGWTDFYEKMKSMSDDEEILSLYLQKKGTNKGTMYYIDNSGERLISVIVPENNISSR